MKQPENNEIDTLLRGWASNARSRSAKPSENVAGSHLDADELSSYAEGVLPVAARARYTAHLSDCDECRKLVAELTEARPLPAGDQVVTDVNRSWRARLAAFFAPSVLKYAVPSLAVLLIAVVFFATRNKEDVRSVALKTELPVSSSSAPSPFVTSDKGGSPQAATSETSKTVTRTSSSPQGQTSQAQDEDRTRADKKDNEERAKQTADTATAAATDASRRAEADAKHKSPAPAEETVVVAPPAAAAPAPTAKVVANAPKESDAEARDAMAGSRERGGPSKGGPSKGEVASKNAGGRGQDKTETRSLSSLQAGIASNDQQRIVAGRKFRREDGKWIDVTYKSSMAATTVARDSEQFRALVADEPEIEAISKQLSGEVIVVWKGRAYHIK